MQLLVLLSLLTLLACAPTRRPEPVEEPKEIRLDTPAAPQRPADTLPTPAQDTAKAVAPQTQKPRRTPAAPPTTPAQPEGVEIRTEKKQRTTQPAPATTPQQPSEEDGVEIRTEKKKRTP